MEGIVVRCSDEGQGSWLGWAGLWFTRDYSREMVVGLWTSFLISALYAYDGRGFLSLFCGLASLSFCDVVCVLRVYDNLRGRYHGNTRVSQSCTTESVAQEEAPDATPASAFDGVMILTQTDTENQVKIIWHNGRHVCRL